MQEGKNLSWASDFATEAKTESENGQFISEASNDADGWQQYRKWISKAPAPNGRRTGIDPSLYTWKGYRTWTEQVKRNWTDK